MTCKSRFFVPECATLRAAMRAVEAGALVIRRARWQQQSFEQKAVGDFVSALDRAAEKAILAVLRTEFPDDRICAEEGSPEATAAGGNLWIIDPYDATSAGRFAVGKDLPSVLAAREVDGEVVIGVVCSPLSNEWFYAHKGDGAFANGGKLSTAWAPERLGECWVDMNQYGDSRRETEPFRKLRDRLRTPSGAALVTTFPPHSNAACWIAQGQRKLAVVIHDNDPAKVKQELWDVAGPRFVLEQAGGVCVNLRGERYDPRKPEPFMMAATMNLARQVIALLG